MLRILPLVLFCGCHWILPLHGAVDRSGVDAGVDAADVDAADVDAGDTPPVPSTQVNCACASNTDDCDGLPPGRDIEPGVCNELLWEDTFAADPLTSNDWRMINGAWSWSPGWMSQAATDNPDQSDGYYWAIKGLSQTVDPHYLVEARLVLEAMPNPGFWQAGIVARVSQATTGVDQLPQDFISCVARLDRVADTCADCTSPGSHVGNPDLRVEARAGGENLTGKPASGWPVASNTWILPRAAMATSSPG